MKKVIWFIVLCGLAIIAVGFIAAYRADAQPPLNKPEVTKRISNVQLDIARMSRQIQRFTQESANKLRDLMLIRKGLQAELKEYETTLKRLNTPPPKPATKKAPKKVKSPPEPKPKPIKEAKPGLSPPSTKQKPLTQEK